MKNFLVCIVVMLASICMIYGQVKQTTPTKSTLNKKATSTKPNWIHSGINKNNKTTSTNTLSTSPLQNIENRTEIANNKNSILLELYNENEQTKKLNALVPNEILFPNLKKNGELNHLKQQTANERKLDNKKIQSLFYGLNINNKHKPIQFSRWYAGFTLGYAPNFSNTLFPVASYSDTPLNVSFNNISSGFVPFTVSLGRYSPSYNFSYGLEFAYYMTTSGVYNKEVIDTVSFANLSWVYSGGSKPKSTVFSTGINFTYYFKNIIISGRDIYRIFFSLTPKLYVLNYSDVFKIATAPNKIYTSSSTDIDLTQPYSKEYRRDFGYLPLVGANFSFGATARVGYHFILLVKVGGDVIVPITEEHTEKTNSLEEALMNTQVIGSGSIPWAPEKRNIRLHSSSLLDFSFGVQYLF